MAVDRVTVDLSAYPDLVMILLGMRVNTVTGVKTLLGFGPRITKAARDLPDGLLSHETFLWSCSHRTPVFVSTGGTSRRWRLGLAQNRIARGGRASSEIPGAPASGTRPISCGAAWRPSSMTFQRPSASCVSRRVVLRRAACLRRANGPRPPTPRVSRTSRRLHP